MHPIFQKRERLGLYLAAWTPMVVLLAGLLVFIGGSPWVEALIFALPLTLLYAFLCLAAWYPCRAQPLQSTSIARALAIHVTTGLVSAATWVALALGLAHLLQRSDRFAGVVTRLTDQAIILLAFGFLTYLLSVSVHYLFVAFESSRQIERRALEAEVAAKIAELEVLRSQVNPHFLFNSLNSVSSLTARDPAAARKMCIELGDFLRCTLRLSAQPMISLTKELSVVHRFLAIEKFRFGDRLQVSQEIQDSCLYRLVPSMLLQPLVENALKHGIAGLIEGGILGIQISCSRDKLRISITNPFDPHDTPRRGEGLGLPNVRRRLRNLYGPAATLRTRSEDGIFRVEVVFPALGRKAQQRDS